MLWCWDGSNHCAKKNSGFPQVALREFASWRSRSTPTDCRRQSCCFWQRLLLWLRHLRVASAHWPSSRWAARLFVCRTDRSTERSVCLFNFACLERMVVTRRAAAAREAAGGSSSSNVARPAASPANQRPSSPPARAQSPRSKTGVARSRSRVRVSSRAPRAAEKRAPSPLREEGASLSRAGPQKLRIASRAQVIDDGASSKAEDAAGEAGPRRGGLRGRSLSKRLQTGPLPSVRNLSGFTDDGEEEQFPTSVAAQQGRQAGGSQELPGVSGETLVSAENSDRLPRGKLTQLLLSYCCYASLYLTRKPFANAKSTLQLQLGLTTSALGVVDSAFLGAYALSQLFLGPFLSSHFSSRMERVLAGAFAVSAFSSAVVGMLPTQAVNVYSLSTAWALNGAAQALAFPFIVALLTGWLLPQEKGGVLGAFSAVHKRSALFSPTRSPSASPLLRSVQALGPPASSWVPSSRASSPASC